MSDEVEALKARIGALEGLMVAHDAATGVFIKVASDAMVALQAANDVIRLLSPEQAKEIDKMYAGWTSLIQYLRALRDRSVPGSATRN